MRPLSEDESRTFFEKLMKFVGLGAKELVDRTDEQYVFRLHHDRVYYVSEEVMRRAENVSRESLLSLGTCFGKFTKTRKFRLNITSLDYLAKFAQHKVWLTEAAEKSFLYGNHVFKSGVARMSEGIPANAGVVLCSMSDMPLGFGTTAKSSGEVRLLDSTAIFVFNQGDLGQYLREEDTTLL